MPRWTVFVGPTLSVRDAAHVADARFEPPIRRGDLERHYAAGARHFGIVDCAEGLSVTITEIRSVLQGGACVVGAAGTGALRAVEAEPLGMVGVGWIYDAFRRGALDADDELAVAVDARQTPISEPLVNIRWALERATSERNLDEEEAAGLLAIARAAALRDRSYERLAQCAKGTLSLAAARFVEFVRPRRRELDRKRLDAIALMSGIAGGCFARRSVARTRLSFVEREPPARDAFLGTPADTRKHAGTPRQWSTERALEILARDGSSVGISRVADQTMLDALGVPTFSAVLPAAEDGSFTVFCGKGDTRAGARIGAIAEAIERACLTPGTRRLEWASLDAMARGRQVLDPRALVLDATSTWEPRHALAWWPMRDVRDGSETWVPADAVFFPFRPPSPRLFARSTKGAAAGASLTEALVCALCELLERHGSALALYLGEGSILDLDTVRAARTRALMELLASHGLRVRVVVVHDRVPLPVFLATVWAAAGGLPRRGSSCRLDPHDALHDAILEALQEHASLSGAHEGSARDTSTATGADRTSRANRELVRPENSLDLRALPDVGTASATGDVAVVLERLAAAGFSRVLACDLSHASCSLKVVRAVVPGLEADNDPARIGPTIRGRLRDLGLLPQSSGEQRKEWQ